MKFTLIFWVTTITMSAAQITSYENADGSYSVVNSADPTPGNTGAAVYNLITKQSGWTQNSGVPNRISISTSGAANSPLKLISNTVRVAANIPYVEILKLVESFLTIKGELVGNFYTLLQDNSHIVAALRDTLVENIPRLHSFTLNGIIILRKLLQFLGSLIGNVNVSVNGDDWTRQ